jgi:serine/threonine protein kinase
MQHPNIVAVYEVGRDGGHDFFTMALIDGIDLKAAIRQGRLETRRVAEWFVNVARALDYAHSRGVIHRDIKPANILLDDAQQPQLTDFGIAKRLNASEDQTKSGQILGTIVYMAPEQIVDSKSVGPAADVYGLGATMYECLTGNAPFDSESIVQLLSDVRHRLPAPVREIYPDIDPDLETICMRCLQKDPADRYASAAQLADDLERYLAGEPLRDSPLSWRKSIGRVLRFREEHASLASAGATGWVVLISVTFHPAVFLLCATRQNAVLLWSLLSVWTCVAGTVNYVYHWRQYWRLSPVERQSGMIFLFVNVSFACLFFIHGPLCKRRWNTVALGRAKNVALEMGN